MKNRILKLIVFFLIFAGGFFACKKNDTTNGSKKTTGIVIGSYSNGFFSLLVNVDEKYPIGKTIEYLENSGNCITISNKGVYRNTIQVQPYLQSEVETIINKRIAFSYREFVKDKDNALFFINIDSGNINCGIPNVPIYVMTDCQILN